MIILERANGKFRCQIPVGKVIPLVKLFAVNWRTPFYYKINCGSSHKDCLSIMETNANNGKNCKVAISQDFRPSIFWAKNTPDPLIHSLKPFRMRIRICENIGLQKSSLYRIYSGVDF
jgi:hypothetical protein